MNLTATLRLISVLMVLMLTISIASQANIQNGNGANYTLTPKKITPKQFARGYKAEKHEFAAIKSTSTKKMLRKKHGNWIQRWWRRHF
jgi:hypothetical protein